MTAKAKPAPKKRAAKPSVVEEGPHRAYGVTDEHAEWCREIVNFADRQDLMPACNGVVVGQWWRNIHTGRIGQVGEIRLAGLGVNTAHSESVELDREDGEPSGMGWPLRSLRDHWELVELADGPRKEKVTVPSPDLYGEDLEIEVEIEAQWERVEPQPFIWPPFGPDYDEKLICSRVKHARPR